MLNMFVYLNFPGRSLLTTFGAFISLLGVGFSGAFVIVCKCF